MSGHHGHWLSCFCLWRNGNQQCAAKHHNRYYHRFAKTIASSAATTTTALPSNELSPVPSNVSQLSGGGVPNQPAYDTRTSGEIQFEWGCMQGYIDASTCAAGGYGHVVPPVHNSDLPLNSEGLVDEGEITRRFWACMEQGGDENGCWH